MNGFSWNIILALIWAAIAGEFTAASLLSGFVLGYIIISLTLRHVPAFAGYVQRVPRIIRFCIFFVRELVASNLRVAHDVVTPTDYMRPAIICYRLQANTDGEITLFANLLSLTPGTLSLDVSTDRKALYIHVMYLDDLADTCRRIQEFENRVLEMLR